MGGGGEGKVLNAGRWVTELFFDILKSTDYSVENGRDWVRDRF